MIALADVVAKLEPALEEMAAGQRWEAGHQDHGGWVRAEWGLVDDSHSGTALLAVAGILVDGSRGGTRVWEERVEAALERMLKVQHESGLIDLLACNFDSAPDTAFVVQMFCAVMGLEGLKIEPRARELMETFVKRAVVGMRSGGFHTPNHRWLIASALAMAKRVVGMESRAVIGAYVAEGIDIDPDGFYIERSPGIYDAVTNRALLFLAEYAGMDGVMEAVERNFRLNMHLLHADGTIETGLSHRQDAGTAVVPLGLASCALQAIGMGAGGAGELVGLVELLWEAERKPKVADLVWLVIMLRKYGEVKVEGEALEGRYFWKMEANRIVRVRRGDFSATVFGERTNLLHAKYGELEVVGVKVAQSYFGVGKFLPQAMRVEEGLKTERGLRWGGTVVMTYDGMSNERRPGYEMPLGRKVRFDEWEKVLPERRLRRVPPCAGEVRMEFRDEEMVIGYRTTDGVSGVPTQIAMDFVPGVRVEMGGKEWEPGAGAVVFVEGAGVKVRKGGSVMEIGPGSCAHRMVAMRDAEAAEMTGRGQAVRLLWTFRTPVEVGLRVGWRG